MPLTGNRLGSEEDAAVPLQHSIEASFVHEDALLGNKVNQPDKKYDEEGTNELIPE